MLSLSNLDNQSQEWFETLLSYCTSLPDKDAAPFIELSYNGHYYIVFTIDHLEYDCRIPKNYLEFDPVSIIDEFLDKHHDNPLD